MEPLFCVRMVLDEAVLHQYAVQNVQESGKGFRKMRLKMAGLLIALLLIGIVTKNPGRTLLTGGVAVIAFAALEKKQRSQKGQQEAIDGQVDWMRRHLAPGELGMETVYRFGEHGMTWENHRTRGTLEYGVINGVQETEQGFFVTAEKTRRLFFWKTAFTAGNPQEFPAFLEQRMSEANKGEER